jgi:hypothetical protein
MDEFPKVAFKVSSNKKICRSWGKEYKVLNEINENLEQSSIEEPPLVRINQSLGYKFLEDGRCVIAFPRIYSPGNTGYVIQAYLGQPTINMLLKGKGLLLGLKELAERFQLDLSEYAYQLGKGMGILHYIAKNDGYDIEVLLGHTYNEPSPLKLYIIDFDLSSMIREYNKETVERMIWGLEAVPHFPTPENPELFQAFTEGYMEIANLVGMGPIANEVLRTYRRNFEELFLSWKT